MPTTAKLHRSESLGPNLQTRLEALEAAMGVRLNLAKGQGRHSLSNTASSSPMQVSPTSTMSNTTPLSLSISSRSNTSGRLSQGVQRSASSCDAENRPGPIKRLKPSSPPDKSPPQATSTIVDAIATIKKYPPPVRRPLMMNNNTTPIQTKPTTPIKQRSSPMDTSSPRQSRSSTISNTSSNYRTPTGISPKVSNSPSPKQIPTTTTATTMINSPSRPPRTFTRKQRLSIFGEQFSDEILKINLFWIDPTDLDEESRTEILLQFGSMENYHREQNLFFQKQQQQLQGKFMGKHKTFSHRSRFPLSFPKKDRLELL